MRLSLTAITTLAIATSTVAADITAEEAADFELFWSYGRSPEVLPSPQGVGLGDWAEAYEKAKALVSQMTNEEKENTTVGYSTTVNGCTGVSGGVPRLGFPGMCVNGVGHGVRGTDMVNAYPAGIHKGATWNRALNRDRGYYLGREFSGKGAAVWLGPVIGPIGKIAKGGRNWEGFSNDPYLSGALVYENVDGAQESVAMCIKHFIGYEQETMRAPGGFNYSISLNADDTTMHELYLWPFQDAVHAGCASFMVSYNKLNNSYASQNSKIMNGLLKEELGFQGFVMSDWGAQHAGVASAEAGMDMAMPSSVYWANGNLTQMVANGTLSQDRLDDMATRIIASYYKYYNGTFGEGMPYSLTSKHDVVDVRDPAAEPIIYQSAAEGHVLLKNTNNALPLKDPQLISIFGYDAAVQQINSRPNTLGSVSPNAQTWPNGTAVNGTMIQAIFLSEVDPYLTGPGVALNGTHATGGGAQGPATGYIDAPLVAFIRKSRQDGIYLLWDTMSYSPEVEESSDACVVFVNEYAQEGYDRPSIADEYSDQLILNVASQCSNTMVVVHNSGIRLVDRWIDHENVTAVIFAHIPGQDAGKAIVDIMFGEQSPSGRLPYTVAKNESDYGHLLDPVYPQEDAPYHPQDNCTEGVYIDYKHFIQNNIEPRYEFGYGLTYTNFTYSDLQAQIVSGVNTDAYPPGSDIIAEGGVASLWDVVATVTVTIENTGNYTAAEVAQLYFGVPNGPEKVLRGFDKQALAPGESAQFVLDLTRRDLSSWDVVAQQWKLESGNHNIYVGKSVLDIQLQDTLFI